MTDAVRAVCDTPPKLLRTPPRNGYAAVSVGHTHVDSLVPVPAAEGPGPPATTDRSSTLRLRLTPKDESFYELVTSAADNLVRGADLLARLLHENANRSELAGELRECEHAGDTTTHQIFRQLTSSVVPPFDREDIYRLAGNLDDVMDAMEAAADLIELTGVGALPPEMDRQVELLQRGARTTAEAMPRLKSARDLEPFWIEVNRIENEADKLYRRLLSRLFGGDFDALTVLKLKEIADQLEGAADALEDVAHAVEMIAVKET
ncbi:MAG: DUF47 domain-containing protein [Mycobacteriales bacterium]